MRPWQDPFPGSVPQPRRRRMLRLPAALALVALLAAACGGSPAPAPSAPAQTAAAPATGELPTVKIATARSMAEVALIWGMQQRFAKQNGFQVDMSVGSNFADAIRTLSQGAVDAATMGYQNVANLADQDLTNIKVVAGGWNSSQNLIAREGSGIQSWQDLNGKKVGIVQGSYSAVMFLVAAKEHGVDPSSMQITNVQAVGPPVFASMKQGALDAYVVFPPTMEQGIIGNAGYRPKGIDIGDTQDLGSYTGVFAAGQKLLDNGPLLQKVLKAYAHAVDYYQSHPDDWVDLVATVTGADKGALQLAVKDGNRLDYHLDRAALIGAARYGPQFGYTKTDVSGKVPSYVDLGPLGKALGVDPQSLWK